MKLGLLQIHIKAGDHSGNLERATEAISDAADAEADLLVLPELWSVGYFDFDSYEAAAEGLDGPTLSHISDLAEEHGVWIQAGSVVEDLEATDTETPATTGLSNTSVLFDRAGNRRLTYRKHHLFGHGSEESEQLTPGERFETIPIGGFVVGVTTCYDLRFPELYRRLVDRGVTLVLVPSAWPYPRIEHWKTLTRARAVENQFYVGAVNGSGPAGGPGLIGRSRIIDPWGTTVRAVGADPETAIGSIEPATVDDVRDRFPALEDRRL